MVPFVRTVVTLPPTWLQLHLMVPHRLRYRLKKSENLLFSLTSKPLLPRGPPIIKVILLPLTQLKLGLLPARMAIRRSSSVVSRLLRMVSALGTLLQPTPVPTGRRLPLSHHPRRHPLLDCIGSSTPSYTVGLPPHVAQ